MRKNYCLTLAYNLVSETKAATERLYEQNKKDSFEHVICDLGFPLLEGDVIPDDLQKAKDENTRALKALALCYGSRYVQFENVGVQQNWGTAIKLINPDDSDIIVGVDPDEVVLNNGWVEAMALAHRSEHRIALASLLQVGIEGAINPEHYKEVLVVNNRLWLMKANLNWAFISFSGEFLNKIGRVLPFPETAKIYGYIEMLARNFAELDYNWCIIPDIKVDHTNNGKLYRSWKNFIILEHPEHPQLSFDEWLELKREGVL